MMVRVAAAVAMPPAVSEHWLRARLTELARRAQHLTGRRLAEVSLALVDGPTVRALNRRYRQHDRVTDVLSFTLSRRPVTGELVLCLPQAVRQARRRRQALKRELEELMAHGVLHLLGYDHIRPLERAAMRELTRRLLVPIHRVR